MTDDIAKRAWEEFWERRRILENIYREKLRELEQRRQEILRKYQEQYAQALAQLGEARLGVIREHELQTAKLYEQKRILPIIRTQNIIEASKLVFQSREFLNQLNEWKEKTLQEIQRKREELEKQYKELVEQLERAYQEEKLALERWKDQALQRAFDRAWQLAITEYVNEKIEEFNSATDLNTKEKLLKELDELASKYNLEGLAKEAKQKAQEIYIYKYSVGIDPHTKEYVVINPDTNTVERYKISDFSDSLYNAVKEKVAQINKSLPPGARLLGIDKEGNIIYSVTSYITTQPDISQLITEALRKEFGDIEILSRAVQNGVYIILFKHRGNVYLAEYKPGENIIQIRHEGYVGEDLWRLFTTPVYTIPQTSYPDLLPGTTYVPQTLYSEPIKVVYVKPIPRSAIPFSTRKFSREEFEKRIARLLPYTPVEVAEFTNKVNIPGSTYIPKDLLESFEAKGKPTRATAEIRPIEDFITIGRLVFIPEQGWTLFIEREEPGWREKLLYWYAETTEGFKQFSVGISEELGKAVQTGLERLTGSKEIAEYAGGIISGLTQVGAGFFFGIIEDFLAIPVLLVNIEKVPYLIRELPEAWERMISESPYYALGQLYETLLSLGFTAYKLSGINSPSSFILKPRPELDIEISGIRPIRHLYTTVSQLPRSIAVLPRISVFELQGDIPSSAIIKSLKYHLTKIKLSELSEAIPLKVDDFFSVYKIKVDDLIHYFKPSPNKPIKITTKTLNKLAVYGAYLKDLISRYEIEELVKPPLRNNLKHIYITNTVRLYKTGNLPLLKESIPMSSVSFVIKNPAGPNELIYTKALIGYANPYVKIKPGVDHIVKTAINTYKLPPRLSPFGVDTYIHKIWVITDRLTEKFKIEEGLALSLKIKNRVLTLTKIKDKAFLSIDVLGKKKASGMSVAIDVSRVKPQQLFEYLSKKFPKEADEIIRIWRMQEPGKMKPFGFEDLLKASEKIVLQKANKAKVKITKTDVKVTQSVVNTIRGAVKSETIPDLKTLAYPFQPTNYQLLKTGLKNTFIIASIGRKLVFVSPEKINKLAELERTRQKTNKLAELEGTRQKTIKILGIAELEGIDKIIKTGTTTRLKIDRETRLKLENLLKIGISERTATGEIPRVRLKLEEKTLKIEEIEIAPPIPPPFKPPPPTTVVRREREPKRPVVIVRRQRGKGIKILTKGRLYTVFRRKGKNEKIIIGKK